MTRLSVGISRLYVSTDYTVTRNFREHQVPIHVIAHYDSTRALDTNHQNDHKLCTSPFQSPHERGGMERKRDRKETEGDERRKKMSSIDTTSSRFTVRDETDASRREAATPPLPFRTSPRPPPLIRSPVPPLLHGSTRADSDGYLNFFPSSTRTNSYSRSFSKR